MQENYLKLYWKENLAMWAVITILPSYWKELGKQVMRVEVYRNRAAFDADANANALDVTVEVVAAGEVAQFAHEHPPCVVHVMDAAAESEAATIRHTADERGAFCLAGGELLRRRRAGTDDTEQECKTSRNSFEIRHAVRIGPAGAMP